MTGISPEREAQAFEMFARGATTREVAAKLGIGNGTAARALQRFRDSQGPAGEALPAGEVVDIQEVEDAGPGEGDQVDEQHSAAMAALAAAEGKVAHLRAEITECERLRRDRLAARQSARDVHDRRELAEYDLEQAVAELAAAGAAMDAANAAVAERDEMRRLVAEQAVMDAAVALGNEVAPLAAAALRAAVTGDGTVRELLHLATEMARAEKACGRSWDAVVVPPPLAGARDPWHRAVMALWAVARSGDPVACQAALPACTPWQVRDREEFAQVGREIAERQRERYERGMQNQTRNRTTSGPAMLPVLSNPLPGAVASARTGGVGAQQPQITDLAPLPDGRLVPVWPK